MNKEDNKETIWEEMNGDLIKLSKGGMFDVIAHGCNCCKNFGAGIALTIQRKYPLAFETDKNSASPMGGVSVCTDYSEVDIVNAYTQFFPGRNGHGKDSEYNRYEAIRSSMKEINTLYPNKHIGLPLIGCGLAGLKWNKVRKIIKEELKDLTKITIVHFVK